jgi:hypothetical protein
MTSAKPWDFYLNQARNAYVNGHIELDAFEAIAETALRRVSFPET